MKYKLFQKSIRHYYNFIRIIKINPRLLAFTATYLKQKNGFRINKKPRAMLFAPVNCLHWYP